ncbi:hypothetical protein OQH61_04030 [Helicobacter sp. MIT 21-1697]|uniref:hypothetical protein n=1 Tax=Helicobacter sp. MIT 21-1697 TaxID=2993733 RepID=UPI00224B94FF|nr:hypothetical protein [Helicobacter sp. MIT 21-1697]MCX2716900.1 hypothetical protein [Helicobacter sp. MIT 21-1697]
MRYWICVCREENYPYKTEVYGEEREWWKYWEDSEENRKYPLCFEIMREGDKVLCYEATTHIFKAVLEVKDKFENNQKMTLAFERKVGVSLETITDEKHYPQILKFNADKYSPFSENKSNLLFGTFFATTKEQFEYICSLA